MRPGRARSRSRWSRPPAPAACPHCAGFRLATMIVVEGLAGPAVADQQVEVVERKGRGHPDSICDGVMDAVSVALCAVYRERCGRILHHNVDKGLLVAGQVELSFGGGRVLRPMELIIGDRAADRCGATAIEVGDIAAAAARDWLRRQLPRIDPGQHLKIRPVLAPGTAELTDIFSRGGREEPGQPCRQDLQRPRPPGGQPDPCRNRRYSRGLRLAAEPYRPAHRPAGDDPCRAGARARSRAECHSAAGSLSFGRGTGGDRRALRPSEPGRDRGLLKVYCRVSAGTGCRSSCWPLSQTVRVGKAISRPSSSRVSMICRQSSWRAVR